MIPRVVVGGTSSGAGKTTVACGLIGALCARGLTVQGFKVGPDYIDPSYHALASGRPGRNLDAFLSGPELMAPLVRHGAAGADIAVIEGVMGLFDGASGRGELASTAHVAKLLQAPVLLVVDGSAMARSAAAIVHGYTTFDPDVTLAGVVFNRVGSDHHEQLLRDAIAPLGVPVLGALRRDERVVAPERHLGLVPAGEREPRTAAALRTLAGAVERYLDVAAIGALARAAPALSPAVAAWSADPPDEPATGARIAIARGPAFSFHYEENLELLAGAGAELAAFDPLHDEALPPDCGALVLAGGFPEVFGPELAANAPLRAEVAAFAAAGKPVLAECGGLLYLCRDLDGHEMCGVLPARASMSDRLTLGYREAVAATATPWIDAGERVRGHEFHYTRAQPLAGDARAEGLLSRAAGGEGARAGEAGAAAPAGDAGAEGALSGDPRAEGAPSRAEGAEGAVNRAAGAEGAPGRAARAEGAVNRAAGAEGAPGRAARAEGALARAAGADGALVRDVRAAWELTARGTSRAEGFAAGALQASYLHVHWAAYPQLALRLAHAARSAQLAAA